MLPVKTKRSTGMYGAPRGLEAEIGGLPYWRTRNEFGGPSIWSEWEPDEYERRVLARGGRILIQICGEPLWPMSVGVQGRDEDELVDVTCVGMVVDTEGKEVVVAQEEAGEEGHREKPRARATEREEDAAAKGDTHEPGEGARPRDPADAADTADPPDTAGAAGAP